MRAAWQAKHHPFLVAGKTPPFPLRHHLHCTPDVTHTRARARVQYAAATTTTTTTTTKIKVIKFTWARSRLPLTAGAFSSRFTIKRLNNGSAGDAAANGSFPVAHTCFFHDRPAVLHQQAGVAREAAVRFFLSCFHLRIPNNHNFIRTRVGWW